MKINRDFLAHKAYQLRLLSIESTTAAGSGHPTSCLSAADIMAVLFFDALRTDWLHPDNPNNDRFILSKGHAAPILFAAFQQLGLISRDELLAMRTFDSSLEGHPTPRCPWIDVATGSLGMGLSVGVGMALHARRLSLPFYTYVLLGDSELSEGNVWEAVELAAYNTCANLIAIVDANSLGQRGQTIDGTHIEAIARKFKAFGWQVYLVDGHDVEQLQKVFKRARTRRVKKPKIIVARTVKGFGIARAENINGFHGKAFNPEELPELRDELKKRFFVSSWQPGEVKSVASAKSLVRAPAARFTATLPAPVYTKGDMIATREAFGNALCTIGALMPEAVCLDAEVSNSTRTELFAKRFPERFFECFIAEQHMVASALGMSALGDSPFVTTFGAFVTRAYDQLRMAAISHAPLRVVGSHAGVAVGSDGPSQMALEDIALMGALQESVVLNPCDAVSAHYLTGLAATYAQGISYLRVMRAATPVIYDASTRFTIGGFHVLRASDQDRVLVIATGVTVPEALIAHEQLRERGITISVIDAYSVKPLDAAGLLEHARRCNLRVITVEDHYVQGGLGQAVTYALRGADISIDCLAVPGIARSGDTKQLLAWAGIDAAAIVRAVDRALHSA